MNTTNHYHTLGIDRSADADAIKKAYRKMAAQHHPDRGGDTAKFQEIQSAYETLSDPQKRATYDNPNQGFHFNFQGGGQGDINDLFAQMFGAQFRHQNVRPQTRMTLWISLADVATGERRTVSIGTHAGVNMVEIDIPLGIDDGATVQYGGLAPGGGDLLVTFRIHPHPVWNREGLNLITEHVVDLWDCILGCETEIRDVLGNVLTVTIPESCQVGTVLRLKGRGLRVRDRPIVGDILVRIKPVIPSEIDPELIEQIKKYRNKP